jgi:hypothetical protein
MRHATLQIVYLSFLFDLAPLSRVKCWFRVHAHRNIGSSNLADKGDKLVLNFKSPPVNGVIIRLLMQVVLLILVKDLFTAKSRSYFFAATAEFDCSAMPINDNVQIDDGDRPDIGNFRSAFQRKVTVESLLKYLPNGLRKTSTWWTIALSQLKVEEPVCARWPNLPQKTS